MNFLRLGLAALILIVACILQSWSGSFGVGIDFVLATLITFGFLFGLWETAFFVMLGIFIINWQPVLSLEIALFAGLPFAAFIFHKTSSLQSWLGNLIAVASGLLILYLLAAPRFFFANGVIFSFDLLGSLIFADLAFLLLNRREFR